MATTIASELDHIDIITGNNTVRYPIKDETARNACDFLGQSIAIFSKNEAGGTNFVEAELSTSDGSGNVSTLNTLLANNNVLIKSGSYPINGTIEINGRILDLNGSTLYTTQYTNGRNLFTLSGESPCIRNGKIKGYNVSSSNTGERAIIIKSSSNTVISGMEIIDISGRGIDANLGDQYGETVVVESADKYENRVHISPAINIISGYSYVRTVGGVGYNRVYTLEMITYKFYNANDQLIKTEYLPPSENCDIPEGATYMTVGTETGKYGTESGFIPYRVGFTNHNNKLLIEDCVVKNCNEWGVANLFGESLLNNVDINSMDIEDHQAVFVRIQNSTIRGNSYISSFYATYTNTYFEAIRARYGHSVYFNDCRGAYYLPSSNSDLYMCPSVCMTGGDMAIQTIGGTTDETAFLGSLLITGGPIIPNFRNQRQKWCNNASNFLARYQGLYDRTVNFNGIVRGTYIKRTYTEAEDGTALKTRPGSNLIMYIDIELLDRQINMSADGDCHGITFINGIIYPNTYTIYDSNFKPVGTRLAIAQASKATGTYVNCTFDAKDYYLIDTNANKDLKFFNCKFLNLSDHPIACHTSYATSEKFEFVNCYFDGHTISTLADVNTYIMANTTVATVIVDGTTIVG